MQLKQKTTSLIKIIQKLPIWIKVPAVALFVVLLICTALFIQEKPVNFSYGSDSCVKQLTFLPSITKLTDDNSGFTISNDDVIQVGGNKIFSLKTCFTAKKAPSVGSIKLSSALFGGWFAKKTFKLTIPQPPVARIDILSQPIPTAKTLIIPLSEADSVFGYKFEMGEKNINCPMKGKSIYCDIKSLNLLQGTSYDIKLVRMFGSKKISTLASLNINTLSATTVIGSSITGGQTVYDKPKTFSFDFDKEVTGCSVVLDKIESNKRTTVPTTVSCSGKQSTVTVNDDLERGVSYEFTIDQLESSDGSTLTEPYKLTFVASDGPTVVSVNVESSGIPLTKTIALTFDHELSDSQDIMQFIGVTGVTRTIWKSGNQVFISYANASPCSNININVNPGIMSNNGIAQNDSWQFSTRTVCHTTQVIGYSVSGRPIVAYIFGSGSQTVLYTGSIHGNELSAMYLMNDWIDDLEANFYEIPSDKKIIVVPSLNPDGNVLNVRYNQNAVDLNRNFPTADWQTDIYSPTNQPIAGGGGVTPLSEPESQAIANYTIQLQPRLTLSFHSIAGYAIANQAGDSVALANKYSQLAGYRDMTNIGGGFSYPITGTYDDWMREAYGLPSVIVELSSNTSSQFYKNKAALWAMAYS